MTEQELRAEIHKRAAVLIDRAKEIQAVSQWCVIEDALDAVLLKAGTVQDDAYDLWNDVTEWRAQQRREKNSE